MCIMYKKGDIFIVTYINCSLYYEAASKRRLCCRRKNTEKFYIGKRGWQAESRKEIEKKKLLPWLEKIAEMMENPTTPST